MPRKVHGGWYCFTCKRYVTEHTWHKGQPCCDLCGDKVEYFERMEIGVRPPFPDEDPRAGRGKG